jgi:hypothetical protein
MDFGTYLPREIISPELAQTCQELRQYLEDRAVRQAACAAEPQS